MESSTVPRAMVLPRPVVVLNDAVKTFIDGKESHHVLDRVNLSLAEGESMALTGASGSGKSTLLNILGGFEPMTSGTLELAGELAQTWNDKQWGYFRHHKLGVVFQQFNLLTPLNVRQNIEFPLSLNKRKWNAWCDYLVAKLDIQPLLERHVSALSGGQQQRVAIARALAHQPALLLADEPTGNLDQKAGLEVMRLLEDITREGNTSVLLVTHSEECAAFMQRRCRLENGLLYETL